MHTENKTVKREKNEKKSCVPNVIEIFYGCQITF